MAVNEVKMNPEQKSLNAAMQSSREDEFAKNLAESLDLPSNLASNIEEKIAEEKRAPKKEVEEDEEENEDEVTDSTEETEETSEESEEEEELIPKSRVQSRIDELTREKKELERRLRKVEEAQTKPAAKSDSITEKLEAMNDDQLRTLKREAKMEMVSAVQNGDKAKLAELMELEDKIDAVTSSAPQRFQSRQVSNFNNAVSDSAGDPDIRDFKKAGPEIFKAAQRIFNGSPELQSSVTGQARAWNLAVEHYKEVSKLTEGKSKTENLERNLNNLKKKVSVDTGVQKGNEKAADDRKTYQRAKNGTEDDKLNFFKKNVISPEMFEPNRS